MIRYILFSLLFAMTTPLAQAQSPACEDSEAGCVLDAAWPVALWLSDSKRDRLARAFLELAVLSGDADVIRKWEQRLDQPRPEPVVYADYGWQIAQPILAEEGLEGLIAKANARAAPLNFGRTDVLLSAGKRLHASDPQQAARLNHVLLDLQEGASAFEAPNLAHAAAELAMVRCDKDMLARAIELTNAPDSIRYALWRARISGEVLPLLDRIRVLVPGEDTREVRRVLEGYRAVLELGYCHAPKSQIGE